MRIGLDIDNVISNFDEKLLEEYKIHDKELRNTGIINENVYMNSGMFDWTKEENNDFYRNNIERIAKELSPISGAKEYIEKLKQDKHEIYIITGRNNGQYSSPIEMTKNWLEEYEIPYDELIFTNSYLHHQKADVCKQKKIDIMIDDSPRVYRECKKQNIKALVFDKKFNRNDKDVERIYGWKDIYNYITNISYKRKVILDTDLDNECDDFFALSYLVKSQDFFEIEAITIAPFFKAEFQIDAKKSQELSYIEALKLCHLLNFDTTNKVLKGATDFFQNNAYQENDAVDKIIEVALKNDKTYILAIGAITNIALAIKKEPKIVDKIEVIWLGGNDLTSKNNLESNFKKDIAAVKTVFDSKVKLTVLPCRDVVSVLRTDINTLKNNLTDNPLNKKLIARFHNDGYHGIQETTIIWDIAVIAYMINKDWFETKKISCPNIREDTSYEITDNRHNITFVTKVDRNKIYEDLFRRLG